MGFDYSGISTYKGPSPLLAVTLVTFPWCFEQSLFLRYIINEQEMKVQGDFRRWSGKG